MKVTVSKHRKLSNGSYELELDVDGEIFAFSWASVPRNEKGKPNITAKKYEEMQLREAKLLIKAAKDTGTKVTLEGKEI